MTSTAPTMGRVSGRLRLAVAGAAVFAALTVAPAAVASPPMEGQAHAMTRVGVSPSHDPDISSPPPGFLLERGRFNPVAPPPGLEDLAPIAPVDLNDRRQLVGTYEEPIGGAVRGYLLTRSRFTKINPPGAKGTQPQGINNRGQIVGKYSNTSGAVSSGVPVRGFLYDRGRYLRLDFPGASSSQAFDINDRGQVVGEYTDANGDLHGYLWERGRFRTIEAGSALAINNRGQITGVRPQPDGTFGGFLLDRGRITTITVPGAQLTVPYGITTTARSWASVPAVPPPPPARGFCAMPGAASPRSTGPAPPSPSRSTSTTAARSSASLRSPT
jgi:probable HAF family extracellular repeat protein